MKINQVIKPIMIFFILLVISNKSVAALSLDNGVSIDIDKPIASIKSYCGCTIDDESCNWRPELLRWIDFDVYPNTFLCVWKWKIVFHLSHSSAGDMGEERWNWLVSKNELNDISTSPLFLSLFETWVLNTFKQLIRVLTFIFLLNR